MKKMYRKPKIEVSAQVESKQPVMLLGSGTAPEPTTPNPAPRQAPAAAGHGI